MGQKRDHRRSESEDRTEKLWVSSESRRSEVPKGSDQPMTEEGDALRQQVKKRCTRREEREFSVPRLRIEDRLCGIRETVSLKPTFRRLAPDRAGIALGGESEK